MSDHGHHSEHPHSRPAALRASSLWLPSGHSWRRFPVIGAVLAVVGLGASLALGLSGNEEAHRQLWHSWLVGSLFVLSIALGGLFFVLVHHATQAGWGVVVRRIAENAMATLPILVLLFVPLLFPSGMHGLFHHWTDEATVQQDHLLQHKAPYLNTTFFVIRAAAYFVIWSFLALWFSRQSRLQDATGDRELTRRMRRASPPGLLLFAVTVTFFAFDWLMSLDPHWYSTIFGLYFFAGSAVAFFAFLALVTIAGKSAGLGQVLNAEHRHDIGKLLFGFVVFWAYMAFSQYMLIWYANMPEETSFFSKRLAGSWSTAGIVLAIGHFVVPFFFLMPRAFKRNGKALAAASAWLLLMHLLDLYWLVMPNLHTTGMAPSLLDAAVVIGCCGVFLAAFGIALKRQAMVPLRDPRLPESLTFENV